MKRRPAPVGGATRVAARTIGSSAMPPSTPGRRSLHAPRNFPRTRNVHVDAGERIHGARPLPSGHPRDRPSRRTHNRCCPPSTAASPRDRLAGAVARRGWVCWVPAPRLLAAARTCRRRRPRHAAREFVESQPRSCSPIAPTARGTSCAPTRPRGSLPGRPPRATPPARPIAGAPAWCRSRSHEPGPDRLRRPEGEGQCVRPGRTLRLRPASPLRLRVGGRAARARRLAPPGSRRHGGRRRATSWRRSASASTPREHASAVSGPICRRRRIRPCAPCRPHAAADPCSPSRVRALRAVMLWSAT
jgi:hypothetical protein